MKTVASAPFVIWSKVYWSLVGLYLIGAIPFALISMASEMSLGLFFGLIFYAFYSVGIFAALVYLLLSVAIILFIKAKAALNP